RRTSLPFMSLRLKFKFAGFEFAGQAAPSADAGESNHNGSGTSDVSNANANALAAAAAHRIRILRTPRFYFSSVKLALTDVAIRWTSVREPCAIKTNVRLPVDQIAASCPSTSTSESLRASLGNMNTETGCP